MSLGGQGVEFRPAMAGALSSKGPGGALASWESLNSFLEASWIPCPMFAAFLANSVCCPTFEPEGPADTPLYLSNKVCKWWHDRLWQANLLDTLARTLWNLQDWNGESSFASLSSPASIHLLQS